MPSQCHRNTHDRDAAWRSAEAMFHFLFGQWRRLRVAMVSLHGYIKYEHRPSDKLPALVKSLSLRVWSVVLSVSPYRAYYIYLCPQGERRAVLPQLASMYCLMFFLGSVTRYRPEQFENILDSPYGTQIENMLYEVPGQFLFLMASEFLTREVSKASII